MISNDWNSVRSGVLVIKVAAIDRAFVALGTELRLRERGIWMGIRAAQQFLYNNLSFKSIADQFRL